MQNLGPISNKKTFGRLVSEKYSKNGQIPIRSAAAISCLLAKHKSPPRANNAGTHVQTIVQKDSLQSFNKMKPLN